MSLLVLVGCVQDSPNVKQIANLKFFIENQEQEGINVVEKGLHYAVLNYGDVNSKSPELSDTITAHFHGTLTDGTVFWSSVDSNEPLTIELSKLIEGCQKIISLMKINDKWRVYIDPSMAYGDEGRPGIPSNSILIFDIELLDIQ
jgi:FKBP-type peptidyl-prolyl cis-trans isomerase